MSCHRIPVLGARQCQAHAVETPHSPGSVNAKPPTGPRLSLFLSRTCPVIMRMRMNHLLFCSGGDTTPTTVGQTRRISSIFHCRSCSFGEQTSAGSVQGGLSDHLVFLESPQCRNKSRRTYRGLCIGSRMLFLRFITCLLINTSHAADTAHHHDYKGVLRFNTHRVTRNAGPTWSNQ